MPTTRDDDGTLRLGGVSLAELARDPRIGTPAYVYDLDAIAAEAHELVAAFDGAPQVAAYYAVKANSAGPIVRALAKEGCGADVVSAAELLVALGCGIRPEKIVFSGVAKSDDDIDRAIAAGHDGIGAIQVESIEELERVDARARAAARMARVGIRVNPSVEREALGTHAHIATGHDEAKFGVPREDVTTAVALAHRLRHLELVGVAAHVGSQIKSIDAYVAAAQTLFAIARGVREQGAKLRYVDTGGGFGIDYEGDGREPAGYPHRVVGPVCESSDDFGTHADLPESGCVAILDAGAYGYVMASQYNGRPLPAEVFLRGGRVVACVPRARLEAWVEGRVGIEER
jgi:diaminopimelate decarboxylase